MRLLPERDGLSGRLLVAQALLLLAGAGTSWLVASIVGPQIFHNHILQATPAHADTELVHIELAFRDSLIIAMGVALMVSVATALLVTAWFTRRIQRSTGAMVAAAGRISAGHYDARVPATGLGSELDDVAGTINELARRLNEVETTRRRLLSDLSHEMRTPLSSIDMHLEAIEDGVRAVDDTTLSVLRLNTGRLRRLAEDISTVSRAQEGHLELNSSPIDLAEVVASGSAVVKDVYAAKGVTLRVNSPSPVRCVADRQRLGQVVTNLLTNALRHSHVGGMVTISASRSDDGRCEIEVQDEGEGIAPEDLRHVFERFFRADPARTSVDGGTGIGLTISRAIIDAHGGEILATSPGRGKGAAFKVRLPADASPSSQGHLESARVLWAKP